MVKNDEKGLLQFTQSKDGDGIGRHQQKEDIEINKDDNNAT